MYGADLAEQPKPYRIFNKDQFLPENQRDGLYGSIPYTTGHSIDHDASVLWVNAAETWVDVHYTDVDAGRVDIGPGATGAAKNVTYVNFISESGTLDCFVFGVSSKNLDNKPAPRALMKKLAQITGFAPLPPINSLGFHFSKWDEIDARKIVSWNTEFSLYHFPVDVFWMDIPHTEDFKYFVYNTV